MVGGVDASSIPVFSLPGPAAAVVCAVSLWLALLGGRSEELAVRHPPTPQQRVKVNGVPAVRCAVVAVVRAFLRVAAGVQAGAADGLAGPRGVALRLAVEQASGVVVGP